MTQTCGLCPWLAPMRSWPDLRPAALCPVPGARLPLMEKAQTSYTLLVKGYLGLKMHLPCLKIHTVLDVILTELVGNIGAAAESYSMGWNRR